jgi:hypothetical protein
MEIIVTGVTALDTTTDNMPRLWYGSTDSPYHTNNTWDEELWGNPIAKWERIFKRAPCSRVLLEKLILAQLLKIIPTYYRSWTSIKKSRVVAVVG